MLLGAALAALATSLGLATFDDVLLLFALSFAIVGTDLIRTELWRAGKLKISFCRRDARRSQDDKSLIPGVAFAKLPVSSNQRGF